jgi:stage V sporulation protein B
MKNNKFLKSTFILIIGSLITKVMGFIIRIIYTRIITSKGISLYTLIVPTYSLMVCISNFALPISLSKIISQNKIRSKDLLSSGIYLILFINILFMLLIILLSGFISKYLLNNTEVKVFLIGAALSMPFMGLACILKGYYFGKQRMLPNTISNIIEQSIRLLFLLFVLPKIAKVSINNAILSFILLNIVTELSVSVCDSNHAGWVTGGGICTVNGWNFGLHITEGKVVLYGGNVSAIQGGMAIAKIRYTKTTT